VQKLLNILQVFYPILVVYEDAIQIHHHKIIGERQQDIFHHPHGSCWGIRQTKGNDQPFKNIFFGFEGSFPYIYMLYWDLMVAKFRLILLKYFSPLSGSRILLISRIGYQLLIVILFRAKSLNSFSLRTKPLSCVIIMHYLPPAIIGLKKSPLITLVFLCILV
jgi:hypothetical protein